MEEFLIKEFEQQHRNIREIMALTFQKVQFFLNLETFILGALLTLFSLGVKDIIYFLFLPALFLGLFGHVIFITTVHAIVQEISLDFVNNLIRTYFRRAYKGTDGAKYIYFARDFESRYLRPVSSDLASKPPALQWKNNRDPSTFIALFVGNLNSFNLTLTALGLLLIVLRLVRATISTSVILCIGVPVFFVIRKIYLSVFYARRLDEAQSRIEGEWSRYLQETFAEPPQTSVQERR